MGIFDQKPRYSSRPLEWLTTGGRATREMTDRFFGELSQYLHVVELPEQDCSAKSPRLLEFRNDFRKIAAHQETAVILQRYLRDNTPLVRSLAISLLSKHANRIILLGLDKRIYDPSPQVRKHLAKALRRLEAWNILDAMAAEHPKDTKVAWFAQRRPNSTSYPDRLANFTNSVDKAHAKEAAGPSRMPLWFRDEYWNGLPPKSIKYIREILEQIHKLVRG